MFRFTYAVHLWDGCQGLVFRSALMTGEFEFLKLFDGAIKIVNLFDKVNIRNPQGSRKIAFQLVYSVRQFLLGSI